MKPRFEEVSEKIKEAIKVKLVELGAYVDDELADYIIVMLANKKSQQSMTEDLSLFLGANTEKFTSWLTGLLRKLQIISDESSASKNKPSKTAEEVDNKPADIEPVKKGQSETVPASGAAKDRKQYSTAEQQSAASKHAAVEPEINIHDEKDDFDEEPEGKKAGNNSSSSNVQPKESSKRDTEQPNANTKQSSERKIPTSRVEDKPLRTQRLSKESPSKVRESEPIRPPSRKRPLGSAIGAVLQNDEDDSSELVHHSVASAVNVKPRKSSVPVDKQATASLLMKAINDAEGSLEKRRKKSHSFDDHASRDAPKDARELLSASRKSRPRSSEADSDVLDGSEKIVISVANKGRSSKTSELSAESAIGRSIANLHSGNANSDEEGVELTSEDHAHLAVHSVFKKSSQGSSKQIQPQMVFTDEANEGEASAALIDQDNASDLSPANDNTKFVITLNGVDENSLTAGSGEKEGRNVGRVKPQRQASASHDVSVVVGEEENDEEMDDDEESKNSARASERCKFWPNCKNGDECPFHHPSVQCKFFPRCQFGSKCMNIHPQCKFDASCTRPNCPYMHSSKPVSAPSLPFIIQPLQVPVYPSPRSFAPAFGSPGTGKVQCKFYPNCSNPSCPFSHPKPCRYGNGCTHKDTCPFEHPRFPTKDQLNWTANKAEVQSAPAKVTATDN